jgi:hypothetical protein
MPRNKKIENEESNSTCGAKLHTNDDMNGGKIVNMYNKIPSHFIDKINNPNFSLHHLKIPFRLCCIAPSGSGKTNFLLNLIEIFSRGDEGTFQTVTVITKNSDEPLYRWLSSVSDQIIIKEGLNNIPKLDKFDKEQNHLVVFDDLVLEKDLGPISQYYIRARKLNVSVVFLSQSFFMIPKIIRNNCNYMVLLKLSGNREVNMILSEFGLGVTKEQLIAIYEYAPREKMQPLIIDLEADPIQRFRKGFLTIIDPNNIPN